MRRPERPGSWCGAAVRAAVRASAGAGLRLVLAVALALATAGTARAQLVDDAPVSTQGTEFVRPEPQAPVVPPPRPPEPPRAPEPPRVTVPPPAAVQAPPPPAPSPAPPPRYPEVVILLDTSDSMLNRVPGNERTQLDEAKLALRTVIAGMPAEARVQVWNFDTRLHPLAVSGAAGDQFIALSEPGRRQRLLASLRNIATGGGTNLYQSLVKVLGQFGDPAREALYRSGQRFPVIVIVSDGEDSGKTRENFQSVQEAKRRHPLVTVNAIGFKIGREERWFEQLCLLATRRSGCATADDEAQLRTILESFYRPPQS
ncbi:MAG: VWA domain-containing protein [Candidatus Lambdaproteobacteria bacterium]|nr:VWA domain-containing protein [Candidatus Lambdaproteobacteria bacterium]